MSVNSANWPRRVPRVNPLVTTFAVLAFLFAFVILMIFLTGIAQSIVNAHPAHASPPDLAVSPAPDFVGTMDNAQVLEVYLGRCDTEYLAYLERQRPAEYISLHAALAKYGPTWVDMVASRNGTVYCYLTGP